MAREIVTTISAWYDGRLDPVAVANVVAAMRQECVDQGLDVTRLLINTSEDRV